MDPITATWNTRFLTFLHRVNRFSFQLQLSNDKVQDDYSILYLLSFYQRSFLPSKSYAALRFQADPDLPWPFFDGNLFCAHSIWYKSLSFHPAVFLNFLHSRLSISLSWIGSPQGRYLIPFSIPFSWCNDRSSKCWHGLRRCTGGWRKPQIIQWYHVSLIYSIFFFCWVQIRSQIYLFI